MGPHVNCRHVAIIPARGGSQGVPHKNVRVVAGLPLVVHSIRAAIDSGVFATVSVSTDDDEIAVISANAGATVVRRPSELASDTAPTEPVIGHALRELEGDGDRFDVVWLLQATSPLRTSGEIRRAAELIDEPDFDAVVSVREDYSFFWEPSDDGTRTVQPTYDLAARPRRQEMPPRYVENGALYAVKREMWDAHGVRAAGRIAPLVMTSEHSVDVDVESDIAVVEAIMQLEGGRKTDLRVGLRPWRP